jgi:hypothetical protein
MTHRDRLSFVALAFTLLTTACGSAAPKPAAKPAPSPVAHTDAPASPTTPAPGSTGARLVAEIEAWEKTVTVGHATPGHGLGGFELTVEGTPVWPPQGPSCAELVTCCEGLGAGDGDGPNALQLACQLSVAKGPDCKRALGTVTAIVQETGNAVPSSCHAAS